MCGTEPHYNEQISPVPHLQPRFYEQISPVPHLQPRYNEQISPVPHLQPRYNEQIPPVPHLQPRYNEQISPVPWHFVKSRFHCKKKKSVIGPGDSSNLTQLKNAFIQKGN